MLFRLLHRLSDSGHDRLRNISMANLWKAQLLTTSGWLHTNWYVKALQTPNSQCNRAWRLRDPVHPSRLMRGLSRLMRGLSRLLRHCLINIHTSWWNRSELTQRSSLAWSAQQLPYCPRTLEELLARNTRSKMRPFLVAAKPRTPKKTGHMP